MRSILEYKGTGYAVHSHNGLDWVWKVYPKSGKGPPVCGSVRGTQQDAISACQEVIELAAAMRTKNRALPNVFPKFG